MGKVVHIKEKEKERNEDEEKYQRNDDKEKHQRNKDEEKHQGNKDEEKHQGNEDEEKHQGNVKEEKHHPIYFSNTIQKSIYFCKIPFFIEWCIFEFNIDFTKYSLLSFSLNL